MSDPKPSTINLDQAPLLENPLIRSQEQFDDDEEELDPRQILRIIRRRGWLMAIVGLSVSGLVGFRLLKQPPVYKESFQLLVQPPTVDITNPLAGAAQLASGLGFPSNRDVSYFETQIQVMQSNKLLSPVLTEVKKQKQFFKDPEELDKFTLDRFGKNLQIKQSKDTQVIEVSYKDLSSQLVKFVLEKLASTYLNYTIADQNAQSEQKLFFIERQIPIIQKQLSGLQKQLEQFRLKNNLIDPQNQGEVIAKSLIEVNKAQQETNAQLRDSIALYNNLRQQLGIGEQQAIILNALTESPRYMGLLNKLREVDTKLAAASTRFTDENTAIQQLKAERENLIPLIKQEAAIALNGLSVNPQQVIDGFVSPNTIRQNLTQQLLATTNQVRQLQARQQSLAVSAQDIRQQVQNLAHSAGRYADLSGQIEIAKQSLAALLTAKQTLEVETAKSFTPWRLVSDIHLPEKPESQLIRNILLSLMAGLTAGGAAGLLAESLDRTFHTPEELTEETGLNVLGTIPYQPSLFGLKKRPRAIEISQKAIPQWTAFLEAYSFLYTNLFFIRERSPWRSLLVSSSVPNEGKSTIAFYVAQAAANMGQRVLLVDGDRYFPQQEKWALLAKLGNTQKHEASELMLLNDADESNFTQNSSAAPIKLAYNLDVLVSDQKALNPAELVTSRSLHQMIDYWKLQYDVIIIDAPPLLGLSDTKLLASQADGVLLVVRLDQTSRDLVKESILELKMSNIKVFGVVANAVKHANRRDYYYYNYYRQAKESANLNSPSPAENLIQKN
jgi:capsular exopolysaccharide synthesis family protein